MKTAIALEQGLAPAAYAWPGGYPLYYLARSGWRDDSTASLEFNPYDRAEFVVCPGCAAHAKAHEIILTGSDVHWEGPGLLCEECGAEILSAYGDPLMEVDR